MTLHSNCRKKRRTGISSPASNANMVRIRESDGFSTMFI
nr:MAG TPA: hypothetical protein [Caudoviricetes sp.]